MPIVTNPQGEKFFLDDTGNLSPISQNQTDMDMAAQAEDTNPLMAGLVGMGKSFDNMRQNVGFPASAPGSQAPYEALQQAHPVATGMGAILPSLIPTPMIKGAGALKYMGDRVVDGAFSMLDKPQDQGYGQAFAEGAGFGVAGDMIGRVMSRAGHALKLAKQSPNRSESKMAQQFMDAGGELTPAQRSGSRNLENFESYLETGHFTGDQFTDQIKHNEKLFSEKVGRAAGLDENYLSSMDLFDEVALDTAMAKNGADFERIGEQIDTINMDEKMVSDMWDDVFTGNSKKVLRKNGVNLPDEPQDLDLSGKQLMRIRSRLLKKKTAAARTGDPDGHDLYSDYIDQIDELVEEAAPGLGEDYAAVRNQYRVLKTLEAPTMMRSEGGLTPKSLWNKIGRDKSETTQELREFLKPYASKELNLPFNASNTGRSSAGGIVPWATNAVTDAVIGDYTKGRRGQFVGGLLRGGEEASRGLLNTGRYGARVLNKEEE